MVSSTQQTTRIRRRKQATNGKTNKAERRLSPTPAFPIHLEAPAAPAKAEAAKPAAAAKAEAPKKEAAAKKEAAPAKAESAKKEAAKPAKK